jgi:hypothetical protein
MLIKQLRLMVQVNETLKIISQSSNKPTDPFVQLMMVRVMVIITMIMGNINIFFLKGVSQTNPL